MSNTTDKIAKEITEIINAAKNKGTDGYDTPATVTRIEGGTAWVHIPGGVDETPVKLTISAKEGDTVQVRVAGGTAWIVGNTSAPPTDDDTAKAAQETADSAITVAENTKQEAAALSRKVDDLAGKIGGDSNQYFWHTETGTDTGSHITEKPQDEFLANPSNGGGNTIVRSNGVAIRDGLTELARFSGEGVTIGEDGKQQTTLGTQKTTYTDANGEQVAELVAEITEPVAKAEYDFTSDGEPYGYMLRNSQYPEEQRTISLIDSEYHRPGDGSVISLIFKGWNWSNDTESAEQTFTLNYGTATTKTWTVQCGTGKTNTARCVFNGSDSVILTQTGTDDLAIMGLQRWEVTPAVINRAPRFTIGEGTFTATIAGRSKDGAVDRGVYLQTADVLDANTTLESTTSLTPDRLTLHQETEPGSYGAVEYNDGATKIIGGDSTASGTVTLETSGADASHDDMPEEASITLANTGVISSSYYNVDGYNDSPVMAVLPRSQVWCKKDADRSDAIFGTGFVATNENHTICYMIGSGGTNRGIWDVAFGNWFFFGDASNNVRIRSADSVTANNIEIGKVTTTTAIAQIISVNSANATISSASYAQWGKTAQLYVVWKNKSAISVPASGNVTNVDIGTLVAGKRPAIRSAAHSDGDMAGQQWYNFGTGGVITLGAVEGTGAARTIAANTEFRCYATYILA